MTLDASVAINSCSEFWFVDSDGSGACDGSAELKLKSLKKLT